MKEFFHRMHFYCTTFCLKTTIVQGINTTLTNSSWTLRSLPRAFSLVGALIHWVSYSLCIFFYGCLHLLKEMSQFFSCTIENDIFLFIYCKCKWFDVNKLEKKLASTVWFRISVVMSHRQLLLKRQSLKIFVQSAATDSFFLKEQPQTTLDIWDHSNTIQSDGSCPCNLI